MEKLWLIIKREYVSRVMKKAFIIGTILTPVMIGLLIYVNVKLAEYQDDTTTKIAVLDQSGLLKNAPEDDGSLHFSLTTEPLELLKTKATGGEYSGVLVIPPLEDPSVKRFTLKYHSDNKLGGEMSSTVRRRIEKTIKDYKVGALNLDTAKIRALDTRIEIDPEPIKSGKDESSITGYVGMIIGGLMGFFMYLAVFIYGMMIFRSVMEEKTSRIVEVMMSSVKPFQLMMGKIIGVGAVGFTQFLIWAASMVLISLGMGAIMGKNVATNNPNMTMNAETQKAMQDMQSSGESARWLAEFSNQNWLMIVPLFLIFFLLGYLLYASLFAAVGSAVGDDQGEAQTLTLPITIPVILAIYIMMTAVRAPESSLAVWSSIFPLFSPIVMPARLPFNPPAWQIILSIVVLIGTVIGLVWVAGRIYRVGILMYGKKVTIKEIGKWMFYKN
jgi:ABC-2 type transport system permease protein